MDLGSSPERILKPHSSDKVAHLFPDPRSATERTRLPSPVSGEAHSVPTHNSFGPDDGYGIKHVRKATIEPNEQGAVGPAQIQSTWCALSKHVQLMTQNQKFSVKPPSRLEAIAHHADEKEGDCDHQRGSCSDSGTAATPADAVFGSDSTDHLIVVNEEYLRRILAKFAAYYNHARTHTSLGKDAPYTRPIERFGHVVAHPILGGLHHRYARI